LKICLNQQRLIKMNLINLRNNILLTRKWTYMPFFAIGENYDS